MSFENLILSIMKVLDRQRTVSAPYHIIRGKKSGQTIQDIGYFNLHPFFCVMPGLGKTEYDLAVASLNNKGWLEMDKETISLTDDGKNVQLVPLQLNGWKYRGRERLFFARLSLAVQAFSHFSRNDRQYDPVQTSEEIQAWVRRYLMSINYREPETYTRFKEEVTDSLACAAVSELHKSVLMLRLSGYRTAGLTWQQIAAELQQTEQDAKLLAIESLHSWLTVIEAGNFPLLTNLLESVIQHSSMTESTIRTMQLFKKGHSIDEIANIRQLKRSTIEDHFVEMAMNEMNFDITPFMTEEEYQKVMAVSAKLQTKRLRTIKEQLPGLNYFQIRLALSVKGGNQ